jgi:hypothetical protein
MSFSAGLTVGRVSLEPTPPPGQTAPAGTLFRGVVTGLESDPQVQIEAQLLETRDSTLGLRDVGFDLMFGRDAEGNYHDFAVVATNPLTSDQTVVLQAVNLADGTPLLPGPRAIGLEPNATKYEATTTADSRGLELGELSVFSDIFGDVTDTTSLQILTVQLSVPRGVDVSARDFDSVFKSYYRIVPGRQSTNDMGVAGVEYETSTISGVRNWISLMNPIGTDVEVFIRGRTPGGTEYILDSVIVDAFGRVDWSPDGEIFREDPTDITGPPVPFMSFRFTSTAGIFVSGRKERRTAIVGLIVGMTPQVFRNLSFQ